MDAGSRLVALATALCLACGGSVTGEMGQDASSGEAGGEAVGDAAVDAGPFQHLCSNLPLPTGCDHVMFGREGDEGQCLMGCHSCSCSGAGWSCTQGPCQLDAGACPADEPRSQEFCAQSTGTKCDYAASGCGHDECTCESAGRWGCTAIGCAEAGVRD